jgi:glycosyltransferase involved in cell wall biosynthesis
VVTDERVAAVAEPSSAPRRLRIAFIWSTEVGLETIYLNWRDGLPPEAGVDPIWIIISWWQEGGTIERLPLLPRWIKARLRGYQELYSGLGQQELDVLYPGPWAMFLGNERRLRRQPYVLGFDSTNEQRLAFDGLYGYPSRIPGAEAVKWRLRRRVYQGAAALFPWSQWAADGLMERYSPDPARVHIVPPGIDLNFWTFEEHPEEGDVHLLFVGGDFYRKGGDVLLEWAESTRLDGWQLHLVTRDPVSTTSSRVHVYHGLTPSSPALRQLYRQANVFVLPTRADCYSLASLEAMATGLPVVLSQVGGTGDIIRDGETGFLIPPADRPALASSLESLIEERGARQRMGLAARKDVEARYDLRENILHQVQIIRAAVEGWQPSA